MRIGSLNKDDRTWDSVGCSCCSTTVPLEDREETLRGVNETLDLLEKVCDSIAVDFAGLLEDRYNLAPR